MDANLTDAIAAAFPKEQQDYLSRATAITAAGKVIRVGSGSCGVIIVDDLGRPVVHIDETSDDNTTNIFMVAADKARFCRDEYHQSNTKMQMLATR